MKIFINAHLIGCFYHYLQCLVRWMKNNGLGKKEIKKEREDIIYILTFILFKYKSDMSYVTATLEDLKN